MKAEDKIVELLAEYLQKTDRLLDNMSRTDKQLEQTGRNIDIMSRAIADHSVKFNKMNEEIHLVQTNIERLSEENQSILKELLSVSRRVSNLEDKI